MFASMGKWIHRLSNKNLDAATADCEECGSDVRIVVNSSRGPRCYAAHLASRREQKARARARGGLKRPSFATRGNGTRTFRNRDGSRFSLTEEEYWTYRYSVPEGCGVCGGAESEGERLDVDHCHVTGKLRGLLCVRCNTALGAFGDDPSLLKQAVAYLEGRVIS